ATRLNRKHGGIWTVECRCFTKETDVSACIDDAARLSWHRKLVQLQNKRIQIIFFPAFAAHWSVSPLDVPKSPGSSEKVSPLTHLQHQIHKNYVDWENRIIVYRRCSGNLVRLFP